MIRNLIVAIAGATLLSSAAFAQPARTGSSTSIGNISVNLGGTQNIANQTQLGMLNFQLLSQGKTSFIDAPRGPYLEVEEALADVAPNASLVVAIYNTDSKISVENKLFMPIDVEIVDSFQSGYYP